VLRSLPHLIIANENQFISQSLNANVAAGRVVNNPSVPVSFPTDGSKDSQLARLQTAIVTLQNLRGPGQGCPAASTTFLAQQKAIQDGTAPPAAAAPPPAAQQAAAPAPAASTGGVDPSLVPGFHFPDGVCVDLNSRIEIEIECRCCRWTYDQQPQRPRSFPNRQLSSV
jgi:hypothetical protein